MCPSLERPGYVDAAFLNKHLRFLVWRGMDSVAYTYFLARAVGVAVGCRQAVDWQRRKWTAIFTIIFFFHSIPFSVATFSQRRSAQIKNLFSESCLEWPHYYREVILDF